MRTLTSRAALALACLALVACGSELSTRGEALRILSSSLEPAYLGEEYSATLLVVGGLSPYTLEVTEGSLPPGIVLQGATLRGIPETEGNYTFTVTASDGNLSKTFQEFTLNVVEPPPATLTLNVPDTDIQRAVTLRGVISEARGFNGLRTQIRWNPELFVLVPDSVHSASELYALFYEATPGQLQLDLAVLGGSLTGERRLFEFTLQPLETTTLELSFDTEFAGERGHAYASQREGIPSALGLDEETNGTDEPDEETPLEPEAPEDGVEQ